MPTLFKRRVVILPTLWGWLLICSVFAAMSYVSVQQLGHFLAKQQIIQGQYLIVEGWMDEASLLQAKAVFEQGDYRLLITTGGPDTRQVKPDYPSYADKAAAFLLQHGLKPTAIQAIAAPASAQDRTYLSAVKVRQWLQSEVSLSIDGFDIVSSGVHARRTQALYQMAFGDAMAIGILALPSQRYQLDRWWQSSDGIKSVITEVIGLAYVFCCFDPGEVDSHQELWGNY